MNYHIPIVSCFKCNRDLLYKEIQAKQMYCSACTKLKEAEAHADRLADSLGKANKGRGV